MEKMSREQDLHIFVEGKVNNTDATINFTLAEHPERSVVEMD